MRSRHPLLVASVVAVSAFCLLSTGCGSGGSPGVASLASSTSATTTTQAPQNGLVGFSQCMRANGVSNFPDPQNFAGGNVKLTIHQVVGDNPRFQPALNTCSHLLPTNGNGESQQTAQETRTRLADGLSFAKCMRSHGVSRFPDPTAQGQLTVEMVQAQGIDVNSPAVMRVVEKCLPASHGGLTLKKVEAAINRANG